MNASEMIECNSAYKILRTQVAFYFTSVYYATTPGPSTANAVVGWLNSELLNKSPLHYEMVEGKGEVE